MRFSKVDRGLEENLTLNSFIYELRVPGEVVDYEMLFEQKYARVRKYSKLGQFQVALGWQGKFKEYVNAERAVAILKEYYNPATDEPMLRPCNKD